MWQKICRLTVLFNKVRHLGSEPGVLKCLLCCWAVFWVNREAGSDKVACSFGDIVPIFIYKQTQQSPVGTSWSQTWLKAIVARYNGFHFLLLGVTIERRITCKQVLRMGMDALFFVLVPASKK